MSKRLAEGRRPADKAEWSGVMRVLQGSTVIQSRLRLTSPPWADLCEKHRILGWLV